VKRRSQKWVVEDFFSIAVLYRLRYEKSEGMGIEIEMGKPEYWNNAKKGCRRQQTGDRISMPECWNVGKNLKTLSRKHPNEIR
jgi:hypothetical protein